MNKNESDLRAIFVICLLNAFALAVLIPAMQGQPSTELLLESVTPSPYGTMVPDGMSAPAGAVTITSQRENPLYSPVAVATYSPAKGTLSPASVATSPRINHDDPWVNCPVDASGDPILTELRPPRFIGDEPIMVYRCADLDLPIPSYQRGYFECVIASQDLSHPDYGQECS